MLSEAVKNTLRNNIERYEGRVSHMYLDSRGFVTVGVGHLLSDVASAQKLPFVQADGQAATAADIAAEFDKLAQQEGNRVASYYKQFTTLILTDAEIDNLTDKHIDSFYGELKTIYDGFDDFPSDAKLALFDLIFNLGMTNLRKKWPKMNACVAARDWTAAADNCRRRGIADARNDYVKDLFISAETEIA